MGQCNQERPPVKLNFGRHKPLGIHWPGGEAKRSWGIEHAMGKQSRTVLELQTAFVSIKVYAMVNVRIPRCGGKTLDVIERSAPG